MTEQFSAPTVVHQRPLVSFSSEQVELIKRTIAVGASNDELELFLYQARRTGLDPLARQIYCVFRFSNVQDPRTGRWEKERKMTIQTSIDGFRLIAERTGHYAGQLGPFWCGKDGQWREVWLDTVPPAAAKVGILRDDFKEPLWTVALFEAYAGKSKEGKLTSMWQKHGPLMVAKCAEALGMRRAFPQELSGLYTDDEMQQAAEPVEEAAKEPVAQPDVMQRPTPTAAPTTSTPQPSTPAPAASTAAAASPKPPRPNKQLTIKEVMALEKDARAAAAQGSSAFREFWNLHQSDNERLVVHGLREELIKSRDLADARLMAAAAATAGYDPETGEVTEPGPDDAA